MVRDELPSADDLKALHERLIAASASPHSSGASVARHLEAVKTHLVGACRAERELQLQLRIAGQAAARRAAKQKEAAERAQRAAEDEKRKEVMVEISRLRRTKEVLAEAKALGIDVSELLAPQQAKVQK